MVTRLGSVCAAATLIALGLPQAASAAGIWLVERKANGSCTMSAVYQPASRPEPVMLSFVLAPKSRDLGFVAASSGWEDLEQREGSPTSLLLRFDGQTRYSEWLNEAVSFRRMSGDNRAIVGQWGSEYGSSLGDALAKSAHLSLTIGDSDLGEYDLDEARASFAELQRCAGRS